MTLTNFVSRTFSQVKTQQFVFICAQAFNYFLAFELRRKLYRSALKEKPSKENSRLRRYNQNSEKRQSVINCFQDLLGRSPVIASNVSQFMERLVNGSSRFFKK